MELIENATMEVKSCVTPDVHGMYLGLDCVCELDIFYVSFYTIFIMLRLKRCLC